MRLSDQTIQEIRDAADIVEVVEDFLPLKKKGQNWWALSPFTNEKTPSFSVSPAKGIFKCFSTGKGGDSITFVMEMEGIGYIEALKYLANKYGIEIEEEELSPEKQEAHNRKESLLIALNYAKEFYEHQLHETTLGKSIGLSYFKERGFSFDTIKSFQLGYSQDEWNAFEDAAILKGYKPDVLVDAGLVVAKDDGKRYDRFRARVMFPIHNLTGRVIGFGARTLKKEKQAKYLNSPESEVYHKSDVLYGMFQAKKSIRDQDNCYLVEGYTDVISLHQNGIVNVVASSGTSLTENQITLIKRFTPNVTVLFDGDKAGIKASLRGVDMLLAQGLNVRVVTFPDGQDPDSYVRKIGGDAFKNFLASKSQDFILFKTNLQLSDAQGDPLKKAAVVRDIVESIAKIPDPIKRTVFCEECSQLLKVDVTILVDEVNKSILNAATKRQQQSYQKNRKAKTSQQEQKQTKKTPTPPKDDSEPFFFDDGIVYEEEGSFEEQPVFDVPPEFEQQRPIKEKAVSEREATHQKPQAAPQRNTIAYQEQESIRLLIEHGEKIEDGQRIADYWLEEIGDIKFDSSIYREMLEIYYQQVAQGNYPNLSYFIAHCEPHIQEEAINLTTQRGELSPNWFEKHEIYVPAKDEKIAYLIYRNILKLKSQKINKLMKHVMAEIQEAQNSKDELKLMKNMQLYHELKTQDSELVKLLGIYYS